MNYQLCWPLKSVAVWGLGLVFGEACNTGIRYFWYDSIEIQSILIHVDFEDGLSIPVMKKEQLFMIIYNWKSKVSEKVKPPAYLTLNSDILPNRWSLGRGLAIDYNGLATLSGLENVPLLKTHRIWTPIRRGLYA
jgi:hypothetical protein